MEWIVSFLAGRSLLICLVVPVMEFVRSRRPLPAAAWGIAAAAALFPAGKGLNLPGAKILGAAWLIGAAVLSFRALLAYRRTVRLYRKSVPIGDGVYLCDYVPSGCILGYRKPRIYLNGNLEPKDAANVLAHERMHLKRGDHIWKLLGFLLLVLYWFHPLMHRAWDGFCRDLELSCDEDLTWTMTAEQKRSYAQTLLNCSRSCADPAVSGFCDTAVAERIAALCGKEEIL